MGSESWCSRKTTDAVGSLVPSGFGNGIEAICTYIREEVARPNLQEHTDRFVKYLWTVFFFILTAAMIDVVAGFTIGIRVARRDLTIGAET